MTDKTPARTHSDAQHNTTTTKGNTRGGGAPRVSKKVRRAIEIIAFQALSQRDACKLAGVSEHYLSRALRKPHIHQLLTELQATAITEERTLRKLGRAKAIRTAIHLMDNANSEAVQARMVEFLGSEPRANTPQVQVNVGAGGYAYGARPDPASGAKDVTPEEDQ